MDWPRANPALRKAFTTVASGSMKHASSSETPSGTRAVSRARLPAGIRTSSAIPPGSSLEARHSAQCTYRPAAQAGQARQGA